MFNQKQEKIHHGFQFETNLLPYQHKVNNLFVQIQSKRKFQTTKFLAKVRFKQFRKKHNFPSFNIDKIEKPLDINQYAPEWYLTDEILSNDPNGNGVTYSLSPHNGKEIKAAIKIYKNNIDNKQRILFAKREILVFEKLKGNYFMAN